MAKYIVESVWKYKGLPCVVVMGDLGHRCGYVGVSKEHPLYGVDYNADCESLKSLVEKVMIGPIGKRGVVSVFLAAAHGGCRPRPVDIFDVHGSITYSGGGSDYPIESHELWWFGYDCGHSGDAPEEPRSDLVFIHSWVGSGCGVVRSHEYCRKECESLAEQLTQVIEAQRVQRRMSDVAQ